MSEDAQGLLVLAFFCYMGGCIVTLMAIDMPSHERYLGRRLVLWPLYWAYLVVKLAHEVRR